MSKNNVDVAVAYYTAMGEKDVSSMEKYLHPDVRFSAPLDKMTGKEAVLEAVKQFAPFYKTLKIRAQFGSEDQAVIVYDFDFPAPIGNFPSAALLTFQDGLIAQIELFYDARAFEKK